MKKNIKRFTAVLLACALTVPAVSGGNDAEAAKAPKLDKTKVTDLAIGKTETIKIKANGVKKISKATWKSSKKFVKITKSGKKSATIKGVSEGTSIVTAKVKFKATAKAKAKTKTLKCKVTVVAASANESPAVNSPAGASNAPTSPAATTQATTAPTNASTAVPAPTEVPTPSPTPGPTNLLSALTKFVKNVGSCVALGGGWGFGGGSNEYDPGADVTAYIKENLNSLTAENEMKPESILGGQANLVSVANAEAQGLIIPDGYTESQVPVLNYGNIDKLCNYAKKQGIRVRYHGLLWHEQTSNWFFRTDYKGSGSYVTPEIMDKRIEYYITNVMNYVYSNKDYADIVYCWDVVNEYHHMVECIYRIRNTPVTSNWPSDTPKDKPDTVKAYYEVYKDMIFEDVSDPGNTKMKYNPAYVKKAFMAAYKVLEKYNLTDKVELVYNDYDTNWPEVRATALGVTSYINAQDDLNPDGKKLCSTIGMQCHDKLEAENPRWTIASHKDTMDAFREAGMNFQVTEMDLNRNGMSDDIQLQYWTDFIKLIIDEAKAGANITGFTWWGLCDANSWLGTGGSPLLCGTSVNDKKPAYYKVISTAYENYWD